MLLAQYCTFTEHHWPPCRGFLLKPTIATISASFLLTLLLPFLLTAPTERDIRIINAVNRFYAAASAPSFSSAFYDSLTSDKPPPPNSTSLTEGTRSLRTVILIRHLQRILDALPAAQNPKTDSDSSAIPVVNSSIHKNLTSWRSRLDVRRRLYLLALSLLHLFTKSSVAAVQSVLHVLFLPTPFKFLSQTIRNQSKAKNNSLIDKSVTESSEEVLKPGVYAECAAVRLKVPSPPVEGDADGKRNDKEKGKGKGKATEKELQTMDLPDDGEFGGELAGRRVWEAFEAALNAWEKSNQTLEELEREVKPAAEQEIIEAEEISS
ncbi:hypothetical protein F5051DRAFT_442840 [Lentinula edodes]|nr:hypothetical protein F5051DRAFT_442840 [Lentinula edodes]